MNQEVTQSRIHNDDIRMLLWAYYWRMLKLRFLGPSFLSLSTFLVDQELVFFPILKSSPCYETWLLSHIKLATLQQHSQAD